MMHIGTCTGTLLCNIILQYQYTSIHIFYWNMCISLKKFGIEQTWIDIQTYLYWYGTMQYLL